MPQPSLPGKEQFTTSLYNMVENYQYGNLKDHMIRYHSVVGTSNQSQSAHLQMDERLTLEEAKTLVRQREAVQEQQSLLQHGQKEKSMQKTLQRTTMVQRQRIATKTSLSNCIVTASSNAIDKAIFVEVDHKSLVPLLGKTNLDCLPLCPLFRSTFLSPSDTTP